MAGRLVWKKKAKGSADPVDVIQMKSLLPCLRLLADEPDGKVFADLEMELEDHQRHELILKRFGLSRSAAENATPACLKKLKPPVRGCTLVWQATESTFSGSYPKPATPGKTSKKAKPSKAQTQANKEHGTRRSYGGGKWTQSQALIKVVERLWALHRREPRHAWPVFSVLL